MMPDRPPKTATGPASLLTIPQTAAHLQVSEKTIRRWIDAGDLVAHRFGRQWRISNQDLQAFIRIRRMV